MFLQAWLELMDEATEEKNESRITGNREAQHRYLEWRAEKVINVLAYVFFYGLYFLFLSTPIRLNFFYFVSYLRAFGLLV